MTHEEIKEKAHLDVFLPENEPIVKEINNWIHEFMEAEDMDAYWQNSLIHLIFEIRHQALAEERERVVKVEEKYQELIVAVEKKYEGETRHETALKYIRSKVNYHHTNQQCYNGACYIHHPGQLGAAGDKNKDT